MKPTEEQREHTNKVVGKEGSFVSESLTFTVFK